MKHTIDKPAAGRATRNAEQQAREYGNAGCKCEHSNVQCEIERSIEKPDQQAGSPFGEQNAERRADTRQEKAFGEQLTNQMATAATDGHADRDFALAGRSARKQEIRYVGTSDQQHHADDGHQNEQGLSVFPAQIGDAIGGGLRIEGPLQVLLPRLWSQPAAVFSCQPILIECRSINLRREYFQSGRGLARGDAALQASHDLQPANRIEVNIEHAGGAAPNDRCRAERRHDIGRAAGLRSVKSRFADAYDFDRMPVDRDRLSEDVGAATIFALPEAVTQDCVSGAPACVVGRCQRSAQYRVYAQSTEILP